MAVLGGGVLLGKRHLDHFVGDSTHRGSRKVGLLANELVDRVRQQAVLDLIDADVAKVVDEITPEVVQPADPEINATTPPIAQPASVHPPAADQQCRDDLQMTAEMQQLQHSARCQRIAKRRQWAIPPESRQAGESRP